MFKERGLITRHSHGDQRIISPVGAQLPLSVVAPAFDSAPGHDGARVLPAQCDGNCGEAWRVEKERIGRGDQRAREIIYLHEYTYFVPQPHIRGGILFQTESEQKHEHNRKLEREQGGGRAPGTIVGTSAFVLVPVPSCPALLKPQHMSPPPVVTAHVWGIEPSPPKAMAMAETPGGGVGRDWCGSDVGSIGNGCCASACRCALVHSTHKLCLPV